MRTICTSPRVFPLNASGVALLASHGVTISALVPLGAAVRGLDLRTKPPEPVLEELQSAMAVRGFLVFKDQGVLSGDEQVKASEYWGGREIHSTHGVHPEAPNMHIFRLANDRQVGILGVGPQWHNDGSFLRGVFAHVGYHIVRAAEGGGGTIFSHQGAAFDALPEAEQERWQRLVSVNSNSGDLHPLVHAHPISGRKSVFLHLGMTGAVFEVTPKADDPSQAEKVRLLEEDEMRHLFQTYNALLNEGFAAGTADVLGAAPRYGTRVQIRGLQSAAELNGRVGVVDGVLDRTSGRVAVLLADSTVEASVDRVSADGASANGGATPLPKPKERIAIKPANLLEAPAAEPAGAAPAGVATSSASAGGSFSGRDAPVELGDAPSSTGAGPSAEEAAEAAGHEVAAAAFTANYEYEAGDCVFIDNLAVAHRASPSAHLPHTEVGLRILHRTTVKAMVNFDPPYGLPPQLNIAGPNPLREGVWRGGGLGYRWDETIPMQN